MSDPDADIAELRRLLAESEKISPGPWRYSHHAPGGTTPDRDIQDARSGTVFHEQESMIDDDDAATCSPRYSTNWTSDGSSPSTGPTNPAAQAWPSPAPARGPPRSSARTPRPLTPSPPRGTASAP